MKRILIACMGVISVFVLLTACGSGKEGGAEDSSLATAAVADSEVVVSAVPCDIEVEPETVEELVELEEVTIPAGSSSSDLMSMIEHDEDKVNYIVYDLDNVDLDTPGTYTAGISVNVSKDKADDYVNENDIDDDATSVNLKSEFIIKVE